MKNTTDEEHSVRQRRDTVATLVGNIAIALGTLPLILLLLEIIIGVVR
jgi:hypothetical protein